MRVKYGAAQRALHYHLLLDDCTWTYVDDRLTKYYEPPRVRRNSAQIIQKRDRTREAFIEEMLSDIERLGMKERVAELMDKEKGPRQPDCHRGPRSVRP
jgi:hypothetical protein